MKRLERIGRATILHPDGQAERGYSGGQRRSGVLSEDQRTPVAALAPPAQSKGSCKANWEKREGGQLSRNREGDCWAEYSASAWAWIFEPSHKGEQGCDASCCYWDIGRSETGVRQKWWRSDED